MEYRDATLDDLDIVVDAFQAMHGESATYGKFPFDLDQTRAILTTILEEAAHTAYTLMLALEKDIVVGFVFGEVIADLWTQSRMASDHGIYVRGGWRGHRIGLKLMEHFVSWAKEVGADAIRVTVSAGVADESSGVFMETFGLERRGATFGKEFG